MKKTATTLILLVLGICGYSQTVQDALTFGSNDYEGTARTVAMGNAFTALGGDLGAVTVNPASLAVSKTSVFTFSPGVNISLNKAQGSLLPDGNIGFGKLMMNSDAKFSIPNFGFGLNYETGRSRGIKAWSLGIIYNKTASMLDNCYAEGVNTSTSFTGALAADASGIFQHETLEGYNSSNMNYGSGIPDYIVAAYKAGLISNYGGHNDQYIGVAEALYDSGEISVGYHGNEQSFGRYKYMSKSSCTLNFGMNISDIVYLGINLDADKAHIIDNEYIKEVAVDPNDVPIKLTNGIEMNFVSAAKTQKYNAHLSGYKMKFGLILTPYRGLRLGAAVETPQMSNITESISCGAASTFTVQSQNASVQSEENKYKHSLIGPFVANFGAAYTFGKVGLISIDYELRDFSKMRFTNADYYSYDDSYGNLNTKIKRYTGISHNLRIGGEIKPLPWLAFRAGYNLTSSGERLWNHITSSKEAVKANTHSCAVGVGFTTKRGLFFDFACKTKFYYKEFIYPYNDYIFKVNSDNEYVIENGSKVISVFTPEIVNNRYLFSLVFTFGVKF